MPFAVLLDEDGKAAGIVEMNRLGAVSLMRPKALFTGVRTFARGHHQHRTGPRPTQLGATLVIAPGDELIYIERESFAGDHADLNEVVAALLSRES